MKYLTFILTLSTAFSATLFKKVSHNQAIFISSNANIYIKHPTQKIKNAKAIATLYANSNFKEKPTQYYYKKLNENYLIKAQSKNDYSSVFLLDINNKKIKHLFNTTGSQDILVYTKNKLIQLNKDDCKHKISKYQVYNFEDKKVKYVLDHCERYMKDSQLIFSSFKIL
ncbi:MAG: hypothetical protein N4A33_01075 [Bacteriovoracaceae bacterium]|jgi:hypothetical protein|nr:hypothetical protein [Bacteriovoracaceae bacterium]